MSELQPVGITFDDSEVGQEVVEAPEKPEAPEVEQESPEDQETDSASATDNTAKEQAVEVEFTEEQQRYIDEKVMAKATFKRREAERKAEALEKRVKELEAKLPENQRPEIPPLPDPLRLSDAEFRQEMIRRDEALRKQEAYDTQQRFLQQQTEAARQEVENAKAEEIARKAQTYTTRAIQLGISQPELQAAGAVLYQFGIDKALEEFILDDDQGPLITKYLSRNIAELETLRTLPPAYAAVRIATEIKAKASALKPKVNPAPDPVESPRQSGSTQRQRGPKGATYE